MLERYFKAICLKCRLRLEMKTVDISKLEDPLPNEHNYFGDFGLDFLVFLIALLLFALGVADLRA